MTLQEFKAWFQGYTEDMKSTPTKEQWAKIKLRVGEIDGTVTTYPVFIDRYVKPYYTEYPYIPSPTIPTIPPTWPQIWCTTNVSSMSSYFTTLGQLEYKQ
jgi:hypothetical protein